MLYHRVKGCYDLLPESDELWKESHVWQYVEETCRHIANLYGFKEVRPPIFEYTEVFTRSAGNESDIVSKEMYTFEDKGGRSISLRPEVTASLVRAYIENGLSHTKTQRFFYFGPCFRYDRSQKGRYRQFFQFGVEVMGEETPITDAEVILMLLQLYHRLGLKHVKLLINSIGDLKTREIYAEVLRDFFKDHKEKLSLDSQKRLETNPLRILDSKEISDKELVKLAPRIDSYLTPESKDHFQEVVALLEKENIPYKIEPNLVRGLDYYCDVVFEVISEFDTAAQNTIGAGGRYDGLVEKMGGAPLSGVGFATGIERIVQNMVQENASIPSKKGVTYYFIPLSEKAKSISFDLMQKARNLGISSLLHQKNFHIKKGLQTATALGAEFAIILGDEEIGENKVKVKHLFSRFEKDFPFSSLFDLTQLMQEYHDESK